MTLVILDTAIPAVKRVRPPRIGDARGWFQETYRTEWADALGHGGPFVQDNHAFSARRGVLRGLHFQYPAPQAKLIRVVQGAILDVAVDLRRGSPSFGRHVAIELSASNGEQLFVPHGFAHGYVTLEDQTQVLYKVDAVYAPDGEGGVRWNDPALGIDWRLDQAPVLSAKDGRWPLLAELQTPF